MLHLPQKALVTGASKGLGWAIAQKLALKGCSVTLLSRNEALLKKNVERLPKVHSSQVHGFIPFDLAQLIKPDLGEEDMNNILKELKDISILVNCAGVTSHYLLPRMETRMIDLIIGLNLTAPIILSKLAYKPMIATYKKNSQSSSISKPQILNISSILSFTGLTVPGTAVYAATKAGLLGFTESLSAEFKGSIRVNAILPALIEETDMGKTAKSSDKIPKITLAQAVNKIIEVLEDESLDGKCISIVGDESRILKCQ
ncbi:uncharacterized protein PRCAT00006323001 [Priceomyces carsonii]|uniref:uncharacterized protein n=1 Tax=Priceomyces carsonii TaxID=28549 RepID=UPI002ED96B49|nr:unnamed protein product [Priceomyces carsonii]